MVTTTNDGEKSLFKKCHFLVLCKKIAKPNPYPEGATGVSMTTNNYVLLSVTLVVRYGIFEKQLKKNHDRP